MFQRMFVAHPREMNESYWQHQKIALTIALRLMAAGLAALVHAFVPGLCVRTARTLVRELDQEFSRR